MVVLEEKRRTTITFCTTIVILFILCVIVVLFKFFTKDNIATKETIVGVNPVSTTKLIMTYEEPLTVILEEKQEKVKLQQKEPEEILQNASECFEEKKVSLEFEIDEPNEISEVNEIEQKAQLTQEMEIIHVREERQEELQEDIVIAREPQLEQYKEEIIPEIVIEKEQPESVLVQNAILTEYKGFATIGKIEIPKTGVDLPILDQVTVEGMKNAPCLLYSTGELNKSGNNLIVGHNFRNNTLFSNNKNLNLGDKVYMTTLDGNRVEYTIYNKFITTAEDVSYLTKDTNSEPEITLSCCTDDDEYRIIILARI